MVRRHFNDVWERDIAEQRTPESTFEPVIDFLKYRAREMMIDGSRRSIQHIIRTSSASRECAHSARAVSSISRRRSSEFYFSRAVTNGRRIRLFFDSLSAPLRRYSPAPVLIASEISFHRETIRNPILSREMDCVLVLRPRREQVGCKKLWNTNFKITVYEKP